jgi:hypothetical protein
MDYQVHPEAARPLTEPQKRWRSWQKAVNERKINPFTPKEKSEEEIKKNKAKRKATKKSRRANR